MLGGPAKRARLQFDSADESSPMATSSHSIGSPHLADIKLTNEQSPQLGELISVKSFTPTLRS